MIRFEKKQLGYIMALRAFGEAASKCGNNIERQLTRAQSEYDIFCRRHGHERKFMLGINKAFQDFVHKRGANCMAREAMPMAPAEEPSPVLAFAPRWPQQEAPPPGARKGSPMPFWRKQQEPLRVKTDEVSATSSCAV